MSEFSHIHRELAGLKPAGLMALGLRPATQTTSWRLLSTEELRGVLPGYEVLELIGRGGMGAVYKARQPGLSRNVAIKVLPLEISADPDFADRFRREARILANLHHPSIVAVYDSGETTEGHLFYVMEFVEGTDLQKRICAGEVEAGFAARVIDQVCFALEHAHGHGIIHRDLKPSNVLLGPNDSLKVADFGLAIQSSDLQERLTRTGMTLGTAEYAAPEQASAKEVGPQTDIYSLGVLAYELLTGVLPRGHFDLPSKMKPVLWRFDQILLKALSQNPAERHGSAAVFRTEFLRAAEASLLAMAEDQILSTSEAQRLEELYAGAMDSASPGLRAFVEEELLTSSGFRESRALEDALSKGGTSLDELRSLEAQHILRMTERAGVARVEIAHDRLAGPIQASRSRRQANEASVAAAVREDEIRSKLRRRNRLALAFCALFLLACGGIAAALIKNHEARFNAQQANANRREAETLIAFLLGRMQYITQSLARIDMAEQLLSQVEKYYATATSRVDDADFLRNKADFLRLKGNVRQELSKLDDAIGAFREGVALRERLASLRPQEVRWRLDWAEDLQHLENVLRSRGDSKEADEALDQKNSVARAALTIEPKNQAAWDYLLRGLIMEARRSIEAGQLEAGLERLAALAQESAERERKHPNSWPDKYSMYRAHRALATELEKANRLEPALSAAKICQRIALEKTSHEPNNLIHETTLARADAAVGALLQKLGRLAESITSLKRAAELQEKIVKASPKRESARAELSKIYEQLAQGLEAAGLSAEREAILARRTRL